MALKESCAACSARAAGAADQAGNPASGATGRAGPPPLHSPGGGNSAGSGMSWCETGILRSSTPVGVASAVAEDPAHRGVLSSGSFLPFR
ncbi:hypothetical protein ACFFMP_16095 [Pseudoroseomonas cervicalis]